ncbi:hypothetical protein HPB49_011384 [Dermacentor silvarum]|uniref:Uncharacterized protein n=1 Tax=Dermacentor silvarum TaxID=543639 RepID=A0ACB8DCK0_DERSI|nr:hypothetical protein HPB49_011384 [Dermacentor silvarum]
MLPESDKVVTVPLTPQELAILAEVDSRLFGFWKLNTPENFKRKALILKGVRHLEQVLIAHHQRSKRPQGGDADTTGPASAGTVPALDPPMDHSGSDGVISVGHDRMSFQASTPAAPKEIDPKTFCKLGHFQLLLEDYAKEEFSTRKSGTKAIGTANFSESGVMFRSYAKSGPCDINISDGRVWSGSDHPGVNATARVGYVQSASNVYVRQELEK